MTKHVLTIPVSPQLPRPFNHERVIARFVIDEDLVLRISAKAATQSEQAEAEVYNLCFAVKVVWRSIMDSNLAMALEPHVGR